MIPSPDSAHAFLMLSVALVIPARSVLLGFFKPLGAFSSSTTQLIVFMSPCFWQDSFYGLTRGEGCTDCACDETGALSLQCNEQGQCSCKFGVGGDRCDQCEPGYFGINEHGCKGTVVSFLGSVCLFCHCVSVNVNQDHFSETNFRKTTRLRFQSVRTARCLVRCVTVSPGSVSVRPTRRASAASRARPTRGVTIRLEAARQALGSLVQFVGTLCARYLLVGAEFSHFFRRQACACNLTGSLGENCDVDTGACECFDEFNGDKCDRCKFGFYAFPTCRACNCDVAGTVANVCERSAVCQCDGTGACPCKVSAGFWELVLLFLWCIPFAVGNHQSNATLFAGEC